MQSDFESDDFDAGTGAEDVQDNNGDNGDFDFDSLVQEAVQLKSDAQRLKDSRKAIKEKKPMSGAELTSMLQDIRRIELQQEWLPVANVAMFQVQHCTCCDNYSPAFQGVFQRQRNRTVKGVDRWIAVEPSANVGLKKEVKTTEVDVPMCHFCVDEQGYPGKDLGIVFDDEPAEEDLESEDELTAEDEAIAAFEASEDDAAYLKQEPSEHPYETFFHACATTTPAPL